MSTILSLASPPAKNCWAYLAHKLVVKHLLDVDVGDGVVGIDRRVVEVYYRLCHCHGALYGGGLLAHCFQSRPAFLILLWRNRGHQLLYDGPS
jgi:hypothetical protein